MWLVPGLIIAFRSDFLCKHGVKKVRSSSVTVGNGRQICDRLCSDRVTCAVTYSSAGNVEMKGLRWQGVVDRGDKWRMYGGGGVNG